MSKSDRRTASFGKIGFLMIYWRSSKMPFLRRKSLFSNRLRRLQNSAFHFATQVVGP